MDNIFSKLAPNEAKKGFLLVYRKTTDPIKSFYCFTVLNTPIIVL
jgi:hypothetical protein